MINFFIRFDKVNICQFFGLLTHIISEGDCVHGPPALPNGHAVAVQPLAVVLHHAPRERLVQSGAAAAALLCQMAEAPSALV